MEQSETLQLPEEFAFASSTILSQVGRGIIVSLIVGIIVGPFRFLVKKVPTWYKGLYQDQAHLVRNHYYTGFGPHTHLLDKC